MFAIALVTFSLLIGGAGEGGVLDGMVSEARALHEAGDDRGARALLREALEQQPAHSGALLLLGRTLLNEDPSRARLSAIKVLREQPTLSEALDLLTASHQQARAQGIDQATELRQRKAEIQDYLNLLETSPGQPDVLYRLASQRLAYERLLPPAALDERRHELEQSIAELRQANALLEGGDDITARASAAYQLGRALKHHGDFERDRGQPTEKLFAAAQAAFERTLLLAPERIDALGEIVLIHQQAGNGGAALAAVRGHEGKARTRWARAKLQSMLGNLLVDAGEPEAALAAFRGAVELDGKFMDTYVGLFRLHQQAGRREEAIAALRDAIAADPEFLTAYIQLGQLYVDQERWSDAIAAFAQVFTIEPATATVLGMLPSKNLYRNQLYYNAGSWLAWLHLQHGNDADKALAAARTATRYGDADPYLLDTVGWSHFRRAEYAQARTVLEEATKRAPDLASAHYHLAAALSALGERQAAIEAVGRALKSADGFSERDAAVALQAELQSN